MLVRRQRPSFPDRTTPMAIGGILPLPNLQLNDADDAAQMHRLTSPVPRLATAEGEKLRPGGRLRLGVFVAAAAASIRGLQPILLSRFHAMSAILMYPSSCSFPVLTVLFSDEEPVHAPIMGVVSRCAPSGSPRKAGRRVRSPKSEV